MAQNKAPPDFDNFIAFVDGEKFSLTQEGLNRLVALQRQVVAGFVNVPCVISQASVNVLALTPLLHKEGGASYGTGMVFSGKAAATTTGAVTAFVGKTLPTVKVYKALGLVQSGAGDIVINGIYTFTYDASLNGGNGGLVATGPSSPQRFVSTPQAITVGAPISIAHGLGAVPVKVMGIWQCAAPELGYSAGDRIYIESQNSSNGGIGTNIAADATNVAVVFGSPIACYNKASYTLSTFTIAKWNFIAVAEL